MDVRIARLAAERHGVFSRTEALSVGATPRIIERRLEAGRWLPMHPGVYRLIGSRPSWRQDLSAACVVAGSGAAASHRASAALRGLPGIQASWIEISVPKGRRVRRPGVIVHEIHLPDVDLAVVDNIPTTTTTRTLLDLAAICPENVIEDALDDALRRRLTSIPRLRWRLVELGRRPGVAVIRRLLEARALAEPIPDSVFETRLLRLLSDAGLPPPVRQDQIRDRGRLIAIVDFAYPDIRLAIEADGYRWHSSRARWEHDLARRNALTSCGWRVLHVTWRELEHRPDQVVARIERELRERST